MKQDEAKQFSNDAMPLGEFYPSIWKHRVPNDELKQLVADAQRYRFLTSGDRSITVHENDGTPVGFFCGTREDVSAQIDEELKQVPDGSL